MTAVDNLNIYIETSFRGPAIRKAAGMCLIEHEKEDGTPETWQKILYREKTKENELVLQLLINAFYVLRKSDTKSGLVRVFTECDYVLNVINNHRLPQWKKNGWMNAKGKPVANKELWQQASELMEDYSVTVSKEWHSYRMVMQEGIRKEMERRKDHV